MNHLPRFVKKKQTKNEIFWGTFEGFFDLFSKTKLSDQNIYTEYCFLSLASYVFYGTAAR